jgi:hypothetical protein
MLSNIPNFQDLDTGRWRFASLRRADIVASHNCGCRVYAKPVLPAPAIWPYISLLAKHNFNFTVRQFFHQQMEWLISVLYTPPGILSDS